ncbi:MAG: hypothetical protein M3023_06650 [Pseudomonadota bacterium]|nr:hypothetical protein [Pseudomonadota bacterium]
MNMEWLDHPAVQGGVAPLVVALIVGLLLARTRYAWLAIVGGYATTIALTTGFQFSPLTASRKIVLAGLVAPFVGIVADFLPRPSRAFIVALAGAVGIVSVWVVASVLMQRQGVPLYIAGVGIAVFAAVLTAMVLGLRGDGVKTGAAGLGLGVATGVAAILSASIGFLLAGIALAAASGALLLVQALFSRNLPAGFTGGLSIALYAALFSVGTLMLAELPWYGLLLLLLVPAAAMLPLGARLPIIARAALLAFCALVAATFPIAAAWYHARGSFS